MLGTNAVILVFTSVEKRIVIRCTWSNLIKRVDCFDNIRKRSVRKHYGKVAGICLHSGNNRVLLKTVSIRSASSYKVTKSLHDNVAVARKVHIARDIFGILGGLVEIAVEMNGVKNSKVAVLRLFFGLRKAMTVSRNYAVVVFRRNKAALIEAEHSRLVLKGLCLIENLGLVNDIGKFSPDNILHFNSDTDINRVGIHLNAKLVTERAYEGSAASSRRDNYLVGVNLVLNVLLYYV